MKRGYVKAALMLVALMMSAAAMPARDAEAKKVIIYNEETGQYQEVDDGEKEEEKPDALPSAKKIKKYEEWAKHFDMDTLSHGYRTDGEDAEHSLCDESKKFDGWMFVGSKSELRAACADDSIKYICVIPEYYGHDGSGIRIIPKTSGSKGKVLVIPGGNFANKSQWKEIWILDLCEFTEKASGNSIVLYQAQAQHGPDSLLTIGKKAKNVKVGFAQKALDDMREKAEQDGKWSGIGSSLCHDMTIEASASVTIDARGIPGIGTLTAGKKAKVTLLGNAQMLTGSGKAKVTVKECSYLRADIPATVSDAEDGPEFFLGGYTVGVSGKEYNYIELRAGGKVTPGGYGLVLYVHENPTKTKIYCDSEDALPFVQARFAENPTEETVRDYLPLVYINGKKKDSMIVAPSDLKAMLAAFDTLGIKMSDSNAEKVRKLWIWGHAYCWHVNATDFNKYTDDRDYFTRGVYDSCTTYGNLAGVFYFWNTGCNRINEAMVIALNWLGGVESYCIRDVPLNHSYNIVKLDDGKWYYIDFCPRTHTGWDIDVTKHPYEYPDYLADNEYFTCYALPDGEQVTWSASTWYETGIDEREGGRYGTAPDGVIFQSGTVMPDGRRADDIRMSVEERMVTNSGLEFGTEYIGYIVGYEGGVLWKHDGREPEIIGISDLGGTRDYGSGIAALFGMYDNSGLLAYYEDADGNYYAPLDLEPLTSHELEVYLITANDEEWVAEQRFHRRGQ